MIAMALLCEPQLLIADEPTTALDVLVQKEIIDLIKDIQQENKMSVLFISHDLALVANIADRIAVMQAGKIVEQGSSRRFLPRQNTPIQKVCSMPVRPIKKAKTLAYAESFLLEDGGFKQESETKTSRIQRHKELYSSKPLLQVKNMGKTYPVKQRFWQKKTGTTALEDITFHFILEKRLAWVARQVVENQLYQSPCIFRPALNWGNLLEKSKNPSKM